MRCNCTAIGAEAAWIPTPGDRGLLFTLRLYNPAAAQEAIRAAESREAMSTKQASDAYSES